MSHAIHGNWHNCLHVTVSPAYKNKCSFNSAIHMNEEKVLRGFEDNARLSVEMIRI
jgi:hypothetical protein